MSLIALLQAAPAEVPAGIVRTVNQFTDFLAGYVGALAAVGSLSMVFIEAVKKFWDSRTKFQARRCTQWFQKSAFAPNVGDAATRTDALRDLIQLCSGVSRDEAGAAAQALIETAGRLPALHAFRPNPAHALFALELERMMGTIQEAADIALASPRQYPGLYSLMAAGADPDDIRAWFKDATSGMAEIANAEPSPEQRRLAKELADRFSRVRQVMKRKLDAFQLYTGDRWASWNQVAANIVGMLTMFGVLVSMRAANGTPDFGTIFVLSLLGGVLSPLAKDLLTALKRVRNG